MLSSPSERTLLLRVRSLTDVSRCNWQQDWPYLRIAEVRFLHASAIRVSTRGQNDDSQVDDLTAYGCEKIFTDTASGKNTARPELDRALAYLRKGDVFVITRLSRAMRSLKHLLALADELRDRGVGLVVLKQQIDTTTPQGRLVFHFLGAIDEFQRELIVEGTREGLAAARRS